MSAQVHKPHNKRWKLWKAQGGECPLCLRSIRWNAQIAGEQPTLDRTISPSEVARHLYAEGDRHPAGSAERRAPIWKRPRHSRKRTGLKPTAALDSAATEFVPPWWRKRKTPPGKGGASQERQRED